MFLPWIDPLQEVLGRRWVFSGGSAQQSWHVALLLHGTSDALHRAGCSSALPPEAPILLQMLLKSLALLKGVAKDIEEKLSLSRA